MDPKREEGLRVAIERYSLEQLLVLMDLAVAPDPLTLAVQIRARWRYIWHVADQALIGRVVDRTLPQVVANAADWAAHSAGLMAVLDEWINEHTPKRSG